MTSVKFTDFGVSLHASDGRTGDGHILVNRVALTLSVLLFALKTNSTH